MPAMEADPRNARALILGAKLEEEGFEFHYRESAVGEDEASVDKYRHPDGRDAVVKVLLTGEAIVGRMVPESRH